MISKYKSFANNKINEGLGINNLIKIAVNDIWELFIQNKYGFPNKYRFGDDKIKDLIYSNTTYELKCNILNLIGNDIRKFLNDNNIYTEVLTFENFETTITVL